MPLKKQGPPRIIIPQDLIDVLEETYESGESNSVEVDELEEGEEFIKISKLYAKRTDKSFRHSWSENILSFQLTDKRPYRKSNLTREK